IYDCWHNPAGMVRPFTVHARDWFEDQPIGKTAERLWNQGYAFDYVSDRQLAAAKALNGQIHVRGGGYRVVVAPRTQHIPLQTLQKLLSLAEAGAVVIFENELPGDVPGWGKLEERRAELKRLLGRIHFARAFPLREAVVGKGRVLAGEL